MKRFFSLVIMKPSILVGGQAVIEGVMMRVPGSYATAVRDTEGIIRINRQDFTSRSERSGLWKLPVFRGMISLFEALKLGLESLQWSADIAMPPKDVEKPPGKFSTFLSSIFAIVLAVSLFMVAPYWITTHLLHIEKEAFYFNLMAGLFRISFFILYLLLISLIKDIRRLFQYHGAEHKVVFNFESGKEVKVKIAQTFPTYHPRCGTSFVFIVLLSAILIFAIIDSIVILLFGGISITVRLLVHLPLIPLVAGISYEIIKLTARHGENAVFRALRAPGLWLQRITTKKPEDDMVEVAITALESAFGDQYEKTTGREYIAEAIG